MNEGNSNILVVYASCGEGHKKAAEALACRGGYLCVDFLDFCCLPLKCLYTRGYRFLVKYLPFLWSVFFRCSQPKLSVRLSGCIHFLLFFPFLGYLKKNGIRAVVATHFFPLFLLGKIKEKYRIRIAAIVTDFGVHPLWLDKDVDCYIVPHALAGQELAWGGIPPERITVAPLPLREEFYSSFDTVKVREELGIDKRPALLIFSSTQGNIPHLKAMLKQLTAYFNLLVIYGDDIRAKRLLQKADAENVVFFPYYERIWELMAISCAIITKPGGLTVSEALHLKKPLIFTHYIPGQEKINMEAVCSSGAGYYARSFKDVAKAAQRAAGGTWIVAFGAPHENDCFKVIEKFLSR